MFYLLALVEWGCKSGYQRRTRARTCTDLGIHCSNIYKKRLVLTFVSLFISVFKWVASSEKEPSSMRKMLRSSCARAKYHPGFVLQRYILYYPMILTADYESPNQTVGPCSLIWARCPRMPRRHIFAWRDPNVFMLMCQLRLPGDFYFMLRNT